MTKHFLEVSELNNKEIMDLMDLSMMLKRMDKQGACPELLKNCTLGMIFAEGSTRTRISFEAGMTKLGGHAQYLRPGEIHLGTGYETIYDTAKVLSRFCDVVLIRDETHPPIVEYANASNIPLINAMTTRDFHPCQALCDMLTMLEHMPKGKSLSDVTFMWVGDCCNEEPVNNSLAPLLLRFGATVINMCPKGDDYNLNEEDSRPMREAAEQGGGTFIQTSDPSDYIGKTDFLYTGTLFYPNWREDLVDQRKELFIPDYQVNMDLVKRAPEHVKFMHYLPALRDHEVTSEVMDSTNSVIYDQAENRMYTEMALLCWLVFPRLEQASEELKQQNKAEAEALLRNVCC